MFFIAIIAAAISIVILHLFGTRNILKDARAHYISGTCESDFSLLITKIPKEATNKEVKERI